MSSDVENGKVIKAGIGYTIGNYLLKGLSFLTIPIFARLMETSDYGIYNSFIAYETILFILIGFAIHSSYKNARYKYRLIEEGAKPGFDYKTYVSSTLLLTVISTLIWLIIAFVFGGYLSKSLGISKSNIIILVIYSFSIAVVTDFNSDISLRYDYNSFLVISAVNAISSVALSVILMISVYKTRRYEGRIVGTAIPILLIAIYLIAKYWRTAKPNNNMFFLNWGLKYSLPIIPHGISQVVLSQFDRIMIMQMISTSASGIYSFGYNIFSILSVTFNSLDSVWSPWFYEKRKKGDFNSIMRNSNVYIILMSAISCLLMLISPELILILGSKKYIESQYCVMPIVAGGFFTFLYTIPCSVEYYHEKTYLIAIGTASAAIINIVLNYIFILKYGYIAAAYTTLVTYALYFFFHYFIAKHIEGKSLFSAKIIGISIMIIIFIMIISLAFIGQSVLRWVIASLFAIFTVLFEEKHFYICKKVLTKIKQRSRVL